MTYNKGENKICTRAVPGKKKVWKAPDGQSKDVTFHNGTYQYWENGGYHDTTIVEGNEKDGGITEVDGLAQKEYPCYCETTE